MLKLFLFWKLSLEILLLLLSSKILFVLILFFLILPGFKILFGEELFCFISFLIFPLLPEFVFVLSFFFGWILLSGEEAAKLGFNNLLLTSIFFIRLLGLFSFSLHGEFLFFSFSKFISGLFLNSKSFFSFLYL